MCGIAGAFRAGGGLDRSAVAGLHARLVHRGPDETYSYDDEVASIKVARLAMVGLTDGWQPAEDHSGRYVVMANGEVFNAVDLRRELGIDSPNRVDLAVLPELVAREGMDGLRRVDGQFAAAVVDRHTGTLHLARDRFGICPLFHTRVDDTVFFASELRALVTTVVQHRELDRTAVSQYLALGNIVAPSTLVAGVHAVEPGAALCFDEHGDELHRYWRYGEFGPTHPPAADAPRDALRTSVARRLDAEVEIGAYLSGGFDSSAVLHEAVDLGGPDIDAFSVTFDGDVLDESRFQREVAGALAVRHHEVACSPSDIAEGFEQMVRGCCAPQRETYNVSALMLSRAVRAAGVKGVLSGEGADELFFGYDSYAFDAAARPGARRDRDENAAAWGRSDFGWEVDWSRLESVSQTLLSDDAAEALRGHEFWRRRLIPFEDDEVAELTPMQMRSIADVHVQLGSHLLGDHGDAMLMANSVEGRYPFLSNDMTDLALSVPDECKVADFEGKAVLKQAYRDRLPSAVLDRGKQGFTSYGFDALASGRSIEDWRSLVAASGLFRPGCLDPPSQRQGKWDFRITAVSLALVVDELGLTW